jgi:putative ABC transport system substrate-binding protein
MVETGAKRLQLLVTAVPDVKRVGVLWNGDYPPSAPELAEIEGAARSLDREVIPAEVRGPEGLEPGFRAIAEWRAGAVILLPGTVFAENLQRIAELTAKARLPAMGTGRRWVEAGVLMVQT